MDTLKYAISLFLASGEDWFRNCIAHVRIFVFGDIAGGLSNSKALAPAPDHPP